MGLGGGKIISLEGESSLWQRKECSFELLRLQGKWLHDINLDLLIM